MSDDYDGKLERHYADPQYFVDSPLFNAEVEVRAHNRLTLRRVFISVVGLAVAVAFLSQLVRLNLGVMAEMTKIQTIVPQEQIDVANRSLTSVADSLGIQGLNLGALDGPMLLIISGLAMTTLLAAMAVRLSQSL